MDLSQTTALSAAVAALLAEADADIAARRPVCRASGRCCRFEDYGHQLFITAAELLHFAHTHTPQALLQNEPSAMINPRTVSLAQFFAQSAPRGCPWQIDGLCTARDARPLGCRIYFCDANAQSWQNDLYEKYHARLQALHAPFGLEYRYLEWRAALRELIS